MRLLTLTLATAALALAQTDVEKRLNAAVETLDEVMSIKEKSIPEDLLKKASCAVIVPGVKKGAFIVGAKFGRGFFTCRKNGGWSAPGAVKVEGGSIGFQIGGSETDMVLLVMNDRGKTSLLQSKFTVGADAAAAAGPVGRATSADTDAAMRAEILTWSRSRGVFAGVSLNGATMREDVDALKQMYGKKIKNSEAVSSMPVPGIAKAFVSTLTKYSH